MRRISARITLCPSSMQGCNNNFKPTCFTEAVQPEEKQEARARCRSFVKTMFDHGYATDRIYSALTTELQAHALSNRSLEELIFWFEECVRVWGNYQYPDERS